MGKFHYLFKYFCFSKCVCVGQNNGFRLLCFEPIIILLNLFGFHGICHPFNHPYNYNKHTHSNLITNSIFKFSKLFLGLDNLVIRFTNPFFRFQKHWSLDLEKCLWISTHLHPNKIIQECHMNSRPTIRFIFY